MYYKLISKLMYEVFKAENNTSNIFWVYWGFGFLGLLFKIEFTTLIDVINSSAYT